VVLTASRIVIGERCHSVSERDSRRVADRAHAEATLEHMRREELERERAEYARDVAGQRALHRGLR
jgi:hypothetical protein